MKVHNIDTKESLEGCVSRSIVLNKDSLKKLGITHVVNCAHGTTRYHVNSGTQFYGDDFVYYGIEANDEIEFDLTPHFRPTAEFIKDALKGLMSVNYLLKHHTSIGL
jgi:hypothetical protein